MKKILTLAAVVIMSLGATAEDNVIYPEAEINFRTDPNILDEGSEIVPTAWRTSANYPKDKPNIVECNYSYGIWAQQRYDVTDYIDYAESITVTLVKNTSQKYRFAAWIYPDCEWTEKSEQTWTDGKCPIVENFKDVVGAYPSNKTTGKTFLVKYTGTTTDEENTPQDLVFTGDNLAKLKAGGGNEGRQEIHQPHHRLCRH